jgi:hypothetical protein
MINLDQLKMGMNIFSKAAQPRNYRTSRSIVSPSGKAQPYKITLRQLVNEISPLPPYSIIIGGCEDGMHFYLALDDPRPGSVLIIGDRESGKHRLVETVLASAVLLNPPRHLRYALISSNINRFNGYTGGTQCYAALEPGEEACSLIHELTDIFAQRWAGQGSRSPILLFVEDLAQVCARLDDRCVEDLMWLIQHGPQTYIWPIVTLHAEDFSTTDERTIEAFGTYLIGRIGSREIAQAFTGADETFAGELVAGAQFSVLFDDQWLKFWVPVIGR